MAPLPHHLITKPADSVTFVMLAIGAEVRAWQDGLRPEDESKRRIALLVRSARSLSQDMRAG